MKLQEGKIGNIGCGSDIGDIYPYYTSYFNFPQINHCIPPLQLYIGWSIFD